MKAEGHRDDDPTSRLLKVKIPRRRPRPFRREQVDALLDSGAYTRTRDMIIIAALSGLRIGEIVRIRGEDIDRISRTLYTVRKGGLQHTVDLHPALMSMAERYPQKCWWFPSPYKNHQFPDGGGHILMASASDAISKAINRAGIADQRLTGHSLRHFFATQLLSEGVNVRVIQEMMGHASLATTQLYMDVSDAQRSEGVARLEPFQERTTSGRNR
jgi:integrase/recombinase XerD